MFIPAGKSDQNRANARYIQRHTGIRYQEALDIIRRNYREIIDLVLDGNGWRESIRIKTEQEGIKWTEEHQEYE